MKISFETNCTQPSYSNVSYLKPPAPFQKVTCTEGDRKFHTWGAFQQLFNHHKVSILLVRRDMQKSKQHLMDFRGMFFLLAHMTCHSFI